MNKKEQDQLKDQIKKLSVNFVYYNLIKHIDFINNMIVNLINKYHINDNIDLCDLSYNILIDYVTTYKNSTNCDIINTYQYVIYISNRLNF